MNILYEEEHPPIAYRIAHGLVWLAFVVHAILTALLFASPGFAVPFSILLVAMGVVALSLYAQASWSRWALLALAGWLVLVWLYSLRSALAQEGVWRTFDQVVDALRFGCFAIAAILVWQPSVRRWYAGKR